MTLTCLSEHVAPSSCLSDSLFQLEAVCDGGWALAELFFRFLLDDPWMMVAGRDFHVVASKRVTPAD